MYVVCVMFCVEKGLMVHCFIVLVLLFVLFTVVVFMFNINLPMGLGIQIIHLDIYT